MPLVLTADALRAIFPRAPQAVLDAFLAKQSVLDRAGVTASANRMAFLFANIEHECGGFTIKNLTENINYTAERMAAVWPNRFNGAAAVRAKYGTLPGWQVFAFNDIYGGRMGNRPGTSDGSRYIGRGGPQITGRDGYAEIGRRIGVDFINNPMSASLPDLQPDIAAAFWDWKGLNQCADVGDFIGCVKRWNGGTNGLADRQALMAGNDPVIRRLTTAATIKNVIEQKPNPPDVEPPQPTTQQSWLDKLLNIFRRT